MFVKARFRTMARIKFLDIKVFYYKSDTFNKVSIEIIISNHKYKAPNSHVLLLSTLRRFDGSSAPSHLNIYVGLNKFAKI